MRSGTGARSSGRAGETRRVGAPPWRSPDRRPAIPDLELLPIGDGAPAVVNMVTVGDDGDPLDLILAAYDAAHPGCVVRARPIGVLDMDDVSGADRNVFAVPDDDVDIHGWLDRDAAYDLIRSAHRQA